MHYLSKNSQIFSVQSSETYYQLEKVLRHMKFIREMLKDQLHLCKIQKKTFETM
jgi:hypothetical protein